MIFIKYLRNLLRNRQINKLLNEVNESRKEIKLAKGKILISLKNL